MKIKVRKDEILKELKIVNSIVEKKGYMVVLSYVLLEAKGNSLKISATDLEIGYISEIEADVIEEGEATAQASAFFDLLKDVEDEVIEIEDKGDLKLYISGKGFKYSLLSVHPDNFPAVPSGEEGEVFEIDFTLLREYLRYVDYAISDEHMRDVIGANVEIKRGEMRLVSTDYKRLAFLRSTDFKSEKDIEFIIPKKAVNQLEKIDSSGSVNVLVGTNNIFFDFGRRKIVARKIEGEFPFYEDYIFPEMEKSVVLKRSQLVSALRRMENIIPGKVKRVIFNVKRGEVVLSTDVTEIGTGEEIIESGYDGEDFKIIFNSVHLREFLERFIEESVIMKVNDVNSPARFVVDGGVKVGDRVVDYVYVMVPFQA